MSDSNRWTFVGTVVFIARDNGITTVQVIAGDQTTMTFGCKSKMATSINEGMRVAASGHFDGRYDKRRYAYAPMVFADEVEVGDEVQ